ncbi:vancomycin resistance protein [Deinococcus sp. Arct2-2]|uniref:VanW family protein n=1 Tax=Deinococcus sp. Arct2-2 TaxID=2568653 RepID=UPI0010A46CFB|nr:VanW family protein [Deinococcus sp. Arct2-2]THF67639.1 vancomycin resistance protein [Deinococcus sp. Arct2-2]
MTRLSFFLSLGLCASASAQAAADAPFKLILRATEQRIQKGEVKNASIVKSWKLPAAGVAASKKNGKVSTTLSPVLDKMFDQINARAPRPASFRNVGGSWVATQQTGWIADKDASKSNLLKAIMAGKDSAEVVFKAVVPERSVKVLAGRGVLWHVSTGSSSYQGSADFRVKNVLVGASKLDNFFIAPDHEFNFNEEIGQIDASTGFVKGFVISGGTLTKEDGGGICQVSTTIFRALYQAGLPITERHEHSHRVAYYDPVGYEATVYAPSKNLRMKNDTGKHLFIQAAWDTKAQTLRFDIFGANTGRTVSVSKPAISNFKAPANPSYSPDDRVALGGRRLLDTPMQGMTSLITRTIKSPSGAVVSKDTLKSVYNPWGAVYGVNPKDGRL